jgi:hypothetical protein
MIPTMNLSDFLQHLQAHPDKELLFVLPDGGSIPAHFHITEIGHVVKNFIDCGGVRRSNEACLLQAWVANDEEHRLTAGKLASIFEKAGELLPHQDLPVEIEYEDFSISQFSVSRVEIEPARLLFLLGLKHTDCLAKGVCLPGECAPVPTARLTGCVPGNGCC